jgi:hypothetical protein
MRLMPVLLGWLRETRRVRADTLVAPELPWYGRRIDLATLTRTGSTTAYELKLANTRRAIEQAAYNHPAFDRSFVVTAARPSPGNLQLAQEHGVGILIVSPHGVQLVLRPANASVDPLLRRRLVAKLCSRGVGGVDV